MCVHLQRFPRQIAAAAGGRLWCRTHCSKTTATSLIRSTGKVVVIVVVVIVVVVLSLLSLSVVVHARLIQDNEPRPDVAVEPRPDVEPRH